MAIIQKMRGGSCAQMSLVETDHVSYQQCGTWSIAWHRALDLVILTLLHILFVITMINFYIFASHGIPGYGEEQIFVPHGAQQAAVES